MLFTNTLSAEEEYCLWIAYLNEELDDETGRKINKMEGDEEYIPDEDLPF